MSRKKLAIGILNIMPTKEATASQLKLLLNQQQDVSLTLLYPASHYTDKEIPVELQDHYLTYEAAREREFDGFIITGAPIELLAFEAIDYWQELGEILDDLKARQIPQLAICWGAQAALYHYYQIEKETLPEKKVGVFHHDVLVPEHDLLKGSSSGFHAPHSRYTSVVEAQVRRCENLVELASSPEAGLYLLSSHDQLETYLFGHPEYATQTLALEYQRDLLTKKQAVLPKNYYATNNSEAEIVNTWQEHGQLLFNNWLKVIAAQQKNKYFE